MTNETPQAETEAAGGASDVERVVRPWFRDVKVGDMLHPKPLWNQTERGPNTLPVPVEVLGITEVNCECGLLFEVRTKGGYTRRLSAGWFKRPNGQS